MTKDELKPINTGKYKITETGQVLKMTKEECEIETSDEEKSAEEEIFNEWKSEQYKDQSTEEKMEFVEHLHTFPRYFKKAFLAGLKAGKPKWHDIRKNPDDLPKHSGLYCVQCAEVREYEKEEKSWFTVHFDPCRNCTEDTYLWCELPKFEE